MRHALCAYRLPLAVRSTKHHERRTMKIAYFSNHLPANQGHGIARYVRNLYSALGRVRPDIQVTPVTSLSRRSIAGELRQRYPELRFLPWGRHLTALSWAYLKQPPLEHWLGSGWDLVHAPNLGYPIPTRKPYVVTVHDLGPLIAPQFFHKRAIRWMQLGFEHMLQQAAAIVCVSRATAEQVVEEAGDPRIRIRLHVAQEGVEARFFERVDPGCLKGISDLPSLNMPFILAAGALSPRKNLERIIQALELVAGELPHQLCLVGGQGWGGHELTRRLRQSSVKDRIHVLGYVTDQQLQALYQAAALFLYPSLFEGFGLPVLEAMASGCPVLTSNISSLPEVAGEAAVLVDPYSVQSIADGIWKLARDEDLRTEMSKRGQKRAASFTWEACAERVARVYEGVG